MRYSLIDTGLELNVRFKYMFVLSNGQTQIDLLSSFKIVKMSITDG